MTEEVQAESQQKAALGPLQIQQNWATCYPGTGNLTPNAQSQLWLLALVAWEVEATLQAHQKCLCCSFSGLANSCASQVFDGMNLDTNQIFK